jgi:hypothetical protein
LAREIREAAAGARGGRAVCGLLLGRTLPEGGSIVIEDSLPLPSTDATAPATHFLHAGNTLLTDALSHWTAGDDKRLWAVGYYQHRSDRELTPREDERVVVEREMAGPDKVLLLTALSEAGQPIGALFAKAGVAIEGQTPVPFPLSRMELRRAPEPRPVAPRLPEDSEARPRVRRRFTQYDAIRWTSVGIVLFTVSVIAVSQMPRWRAQPTGSPVEATYSGSDLGLAIEGAPDRVTVTWNRSARPVVNAAEGTLSVTDQGSTQILVLKRADLATGSLVYFPGGNDVLFRLDVTTREGRVVTARARFLAARRPENRR